MKKMIFVCVVLVACFYFGRYSISVVPIQKSELSVVHSEQSQSAAAMVTEPYSIYQKSAPTTTTTTGTATTAAPQDLGEQLSEVIRGHYSHQLFSAIYDKKLFLKTPITSTHLNDLRTRFAETKSEGFVMHRSLRSMQDRDLIALLQGFSMNKQVYLDQRTKDAYIQILREIAQQKTESLTVRRQAARGLVQMGAFLREPERRRLWKDIPSNIVSLATHSDTELVGALLEK